MIYLYIYIYIYIYIYYKLCCRERMRARFSKLKNISDVLRDFKEEKIIEIVLKYFSNPCFFLNHCYVLTWLAPFPPISYWSILEPIFFNITLSFGVSMNLGKKLVSISNIEVGFISLSHLVQQTKRLRTGVVYVIDSAKNKGLKWLEQNIHKNSTSTIVQNGRLSLYFIRSASIEA